jgi:hypothetical protein
MNRRRLRQIISAAAVAGMALTAMTSPVAAGAPTSNGLSSFNFEVFGADASSVLANLSLEIFDGTVAPGETGTNVVPDSNCLPSNKIGRLNPAVAYRSELCDLEDDDATYTVGLDGVPDGYKAVAYCTVWQDEPLDPPEALGGGTPTFTLQIDEHVDCRFVVAPVNASMVYSVFVSGLGHESALDGVEIEVYRDSAMVDPLNCTASTPAALVSMYSSPSTGFGGTCELPPSDGGTLTEVPWTPYQLGLSALPPGYEIANAYCYGIGYGVDELITDPTPEFEIYLNPDGLPTAACEIYIFGPPTVYVEHIVDGGTAATTDFTTQLFDSGGSMVGESSDPSPEFCETSFPERGLPGLVGPIYLGPTFVADVCGAIVAPSGDDYTVGAVLPDYGYEATISCTGEPPGFFGVLMERVVSDLATFDHPTSPGYESLCLLTATYYVQTIEVDVVVDNTIGGASDGSDVLVEIYDQDGVLVDSGFDPAPNSTSAAAEFTLPIGDYTIGVAGPSGYTYTATVTVVPTDAEVIDDPSADLTLTSDQTATAVVLATGQPAPTTTTTTTTTTTPTTLATPTTIATPTTMSGILPATGGSSTTDNLAWWALGLLLAGFAIAGASRRPERSNS